METIFSGIEAVDRLAVIQDGSTFNRREAADGPQRGGFARAVRANQGNDLTFFHMEGNALERLDAAIGYAQVA